MIDNNKFMEIRKTKHLVVLDTNILLELYRQPANISLDVISALKKIKDCIYIPWQVYDEYIRNYHEICGKEKKKYQKVKKELSESARKLQEDIESKISEYRKHNYSDITKLQSDLCQKIDEIQSILNDFEQGHKTEIQLNIDFLENDKVKEFMDYLKKEGRIGVEIPFTTRLSILQEGQVRFDNLIPPGYMDRDKKGQDKYGDLFVWKSILAVAKEQNANIIFVCNDLKEDWWEKDKETLINLRGELVEEFKEFNPLLDIQALSLERFFSYIAEELNLGKSKSALQLSALDDAKNLLNAHNSEIEDRIKKELYSINIKQELEEEYIEIGEKEICWNINDVSVDKEGRNILYYINLDITALVGLVFREPGDYPFFAGKVVLVLDGEIKLSSEEYASGSTMEVLDVVLSDIHHIEPDEWHIIKNMYMGKSGKELITASRELKSYNENVKRMKENLGSMQNIPGAVYGLQELIKPLQEVSKVMSPREVLEVIAPLSQVSKSGELLSQVSKNVVPLSSMAENMN